MASHDDSVPEEYAYEWNSNSTVTINEFLTKYKPSLVQDDGTKPWLWVRKSESGEKADRVAALEAAEKILQDTTEKVESIQNDASIPTRANKKKGLKSKKELREEAQHEASEKLKEVSVRHGFVSGKWLIFAQSDKVDFIWSTIATSLIEGPLSKTNAYLTKVATSPKNEEPHHQHLLCLYLPDVYDKDNVTEVMKILLRNHGLSLSGVKSNLYTEIGIGSKHPSGIQSTIWRNSALMKETEIKALKDAFFAELNASKATEADNPIATAVASTSAAPSKTKTKPKKKADNEDPFASDNEDMEADSPESEEKKKPLPKGKGKKLVPKKTNEGDGFESDNEDNDDPELKERVKELKSKKGTAKVTKKRKSKDDEDEDDEPPKKKGGGRK
ncbi:hypothetical protein QCA50_005141 [Cerrena zonata]|uniref:Uncharacterized protein n=1 Tax=Cerrena zonata TaxID=2478898 RepID=A0AAW0GQD8_9APHY